MSRLLMTDEERRLEALSTGQGIPAPGQMGQDLGTWGKGMLSGGVGLLGDAAWMIRGMAPGGSIFGAAEQPASDPRLIPASTDWIGERLGADTNSPFFIGGSIATPDLTDAAKFIPLLGGMARVAAPNISTGSRGIKSKLFDTTRAAEVPDVPQTPLTRYEPPRGVPESVQGVLEPENVSRVQGVVERGLKEGGLEWYNAEALRKVFVEELGEELGNQRFNLFMDINAATSPRSKVVPNIQRSSLFYQQGLEGNPMGGFRQSPSEAVPLGEWEGTPMLLPQGYGTLAHKGHSKLLTQIDEGVPFDPVHKQQKISSYAQNLRGNQAPATVDTHDASGWLDLPREDHPFYVRKKDKKTGEMQWVKNSPSKTQYPTLEAGHRTIAENLGISPAQSQAGRWIGDASTTGVDAASVRPWLESFEDVLTKAAERESITSTEALRRFVRGELVL